MAQTAAWEAASGQICDCELQEAADTGPFVFDAKNHVLHLNGEAIATAGKTVLRLTASPNGKLVAVLSAKGEYKDSFPSFLGGGGASGRHYHQVFNRASGNPEGLPVYLPFAPEGLALTACWSHDEKYIVYADSSYTHVAVIQLDADGDKAP